MKRVITWTLTAFVAVTVIQPVSAKDKVAKTYVVVNEDVGVPVFPNDITDRPYTVLGEVKAGVRKATVFSKEPSQAKIYRELWERAEKLGADAFVKVTYGDSHVSASITGLADVKWCYARRPGIVTSRTTSNGLRHDFAV